MTDVILQIVSLVAIATSVIAMLFSWISMQRHKKMQHELQQQMNTMRLDINALYSGAVGIGRRITNLEQKLRTNSERQDKLELRDVDRASYDHAARLVRNGAEINDLVDSCGISKGEAELIKLLNSGQIQH
jgi:ABC-type transport system involved in cytochrome bd biosynthesis fused ATPase/permease subunit